MEKITCGTIQNFIVNFEEPIYITGSNQGLGLITRINRGTIKNGYIYGENPKAFSGNTNMQGIIAYFSERNAMIENIYSLVAFDYIGNSETSQQSGNILAVNDGNATIQNIYTVGEGENINNFKQGPNIYEKYSKKIYNNYYFTDRIYEDSLETKGNILSLYDVEFQNQLLNKDNAFIIEELVSKGYFPHLNMPEMMPTQEYIELPEAKDSDLPDILSTKILEQGTNTVKVEFSVNNPSAATISNLVIENIGTVEILSQNYNSGKSTVVVELKNPVICVSSYEVQSLSIKGAFGSTYTRDYLDGERLINVDLYREIWTNNDWKNMNSSNSENYMLMTDLDFINEGDSIQIYSLYGKLNGNNHTIKNIKGINIYCLIVSLYGTLENINLENVNFTCVYRKWKYCRSYKWCSL